MKTMYLVMALAMAAHADTYNVFTLDSDESRFPVGFSATGDVTLAVYPASCAPPINCFETFVQGVRDSQAPTVMNELTPFVGQFPFGNAGIGKYVDAEGDLLWNNPLTEVWLEGFVVRQASPLLAVNPRPIPEPATWELLAIAGLGLVSERIRRSVVRSTQ